MLKQRGRRRISLWNYAPCGLSAPLYTFPDLLACVCLLLRGHAFIPADLKNHPQLNKSRGIARYRQIPFGISQLRLTGVPLAKPEPSRSPSPARRGRRTPGHSRQHIENDEIGVHASEPRSGARLQRGEGNAVARKPSNSQGVDAVRQENRAGLSIY